MAYRGSWRSVRTILETQAGSAVRMYGGTAKKTIGVGRILPILPATNGLISSLRPSQGDHFMALATANRSPADTETSTEPMPPRQDADPGSARRRRSAIRVPAARPRAPWPSAGSAWGERRGPSTRCADSCRQTSGRWDIGAPRGDYRSLPVVVGVRGVRRFISDPHRLRGGGCAGGCAGLGSARRRAVGAPKVTLVFIVVTKNVSQSLLWGIQICRSP
jgi:hypothetical protein